MFSIPGTAKLSLWSICLNVGWRLMLWGRKAWLLFIMFPGGFTYQYWCCSLCLMVFSLQICKNGIYPRWPGGWMFSQCEKLDPGPYSETKMWFDLWFLKTLFPDYATAFSGWCRQEQGRCLWVLLLIKNTMLLLIFILIFFKLWDAFYVVQNTGWPPCTTSQCVATGTCCSSCSQSNLTSMLKIFRWESILTWTTTKKRR